MSDIAKLYHEIRTLKAEVLDAKEEIREAKRQIRALFAILRGGADDLPMPQSSEQYNCRSTMIPAEPEPARPDQRTLVEVTVPERVSKGRTYGPIRYATSLRVIEGDAAQDKWIGAAIPGLSRADVMRRFWGSAMDRIEQMPPGAGTWRWTGIARWNGRGWSLVEGTWTEVTP